MPVRWIPITQKGWPRLSIAPAWQPLSAKATSGVAVWFGLGEVYWGRSKVVSIETAKWFKLTWLYLPVVNEDCGGAETSKLDVDEVLVEEWQFLVVY